MPAPPGGNRVLYIVFGVIGGLLLLFCCLVLSSFLFCARLASDISEELERDMERTAGAEAEARDRPLSPVTFDELFELFRSDNVKTDLQKNEAWKAYQGKKVKWSGTVREVRKKAGLWGKEAGYELVVVLRYSNSAVAGDSMTAVVTLLESEREKALQLSQGDRVTFVGVLDHWSYVLATRFHLSSGILSD